MRHSSDDRDQAGVLAAPKLQRGGLPA